jgi:hypothetical protein
MIPGGWKGPQYTCRKLFHVCYNGKSLKIVFWKSTEQISDVVQNQDFKVVRFLFFLGGGGGAVVVTVGKTIFTRVYKGKIIKKKSQDPLHRKNSNLRKSFLFKCRNEFHIMQWSPRIGWGHNKEIYFCRWLHGEIGLYDSGEWSGPWASFFSLPQVMAPPPNKTSKFIPYHLILSKQKYYVMKLNIFHDLFLHNIRWRLSILWLLIICVKDIFFFRWHKITPIFQPIEKRVTWLIKWYKFKHNSKHCNIMVKLVMLFITFRNYSKGTFT